jgi:hypothetical protein
MFTIDVYSAFANHGPVFRTRAGQSSCPYEGEELTKYYEPGKELSAATVQIEQPALSVVGDNILTGVPTGGKAQFELLLSNQSGIHADAYFDLIPVDGSNPKGALLSLPTGAIGNGRTVLVPDNEPVKIILTLEQGNLAVTDYENIELALVSNCQNDETSIHGAIKSTVSISAHFVPASTPVNIAIDQMVVNNKNVKNDLNISVTGFDRNFAGLQRVDVQYMAPGATSWSLLKSYIPDEDVRTDNSQLPLPGNGVIELPLNMNSSSWLDGTYQFRAQSSAIYSGKPVTSESEVLTLVKDVNSPQLFGLANPSDGVLNADDEISISFNEDIQQNRLTKNNIVVSGVLNGAEVKHDVALSAQNTDRAAYTEASFNLAKKSFAADMWVRVSAAGDILTHGNGDEKFKLSVDAGNHLVVTIGSESYTSTKTIEKNTWTFLAFNYEYADGSSLLNARAVTDNSTTDLLKNVPVADYTGMGNITLGQNFSGAIHELALWDKSRTMDEAQAEKSITKQPSTPNLIGYWKMDEGDGTVIRDYARNRHLVMPANSWYLNNDNKAVTLPGDAGKALKLDISACSVRPTEDYAMEMWFKGKKADQNDASTLFYAGEESVGMGFDKDGLLTLSAQGSDIELSKNDYLDNAWHHLALNVLRNGNATVYVDATPVKTISASVVPSLAGAYLYIGSRPSSRPFKGSVDEIRLWNASMTGDLLKSQRTQRLTGKECGLVAYYSFEKMSRDNNSGIISSVSSATDLCTDFLVAKTIGESVPVTYTDEAPALKVKPEATNVEYNFVANERSIIITLNEPSAARLEGTTLTFEVSGVKDMNGNESLPVAWTAYVKQNQLLWKDESQVSLVKPVGQPATFQATIVNESGNTENWTLSGLPAWLTASATSGTLKPQLTKTLTFTVADGLAIGNYEQTVYLTGSQNISQPLTLNLKVKAIEPDWAVRASDYEETMNVIAQLQVLGQPSQNEDDIVAAFVGNDCRGVARPEYKSRYDGYFLTMDVYGSATDANKTVTFKVFDASTGTIYPVVTTSQSVAYSNNDMVGRYDNPLLLDATDMIEQNIDLAEGWNWMSLSVSPDQMTVPVVFASADGKVTTVKSHDGTARYDKGSWISTISTMTNADMYVVKTSQPLTLSVTGHRVKPSLTPVSVANGWNWVGYNGQQVISVADALAGMDPQNGDVVKAHRGVAYFDGYEWIGSLRMLMPGLGYKIQSVAAAQRTFCYPEAAASRSVKREMTAATISQSSVFSPVDYSAYASNMVLIAQVVADGQPLEGIELGIFAGDECREAAMTDEQGMVYLTIPGDAPCTLTFRVALDGSAVEPSSQELSYETDAVIGTPSAPFIIDLGGSVTGIDDRQWNTEDVRGTIYDLQGRRLDSSKLRKGVYIIDGQKKVKINNNR